MDTDNTQDLRDFVRFFIQVREYYHCQGASLPHPWTPEQGVAGWHRLCLWADEIIPPREQGMLAKQNGYMLHSSERSVPHDVEECRRQWLAGYGG